jgi:hypothetical protein
MMMSEELIRVGFENDATILNGLAVQTITIATCTQAGIAVALTLALSLSESSALTHPMTFDNEHASVCMTAIMNLNIPEGLSEINCAAVLVLDVCRHRHTLLNRATKLSLSLPWRRKRKEVFENG